MFVFVGSFPGSISTSSSISLIFIFRILLLKGPGNNRSRKNRTQWNYPCLHWHIFNNTINFRSQRVLRLEMLAGGWDGFRPAGQIHNTCYKLRTSSKKTLTGRRRKRTDVFRPWLDLVMAEDWLWFLGNQDSWQVECKPFKFNLIHQQCHLCSQWQLIVSIDDLGKTTSTGY